MVTLPLTPTTDKETTMSDSLNFVIFGFGGDLSKRKLLPALSQLFLANKLGKSVNIIAIGRKDYTSSELSLLIKEAIASSKDPLKDEELNKFIPLFSYLKMDISNKEDYSLLKEALEKTQSEKVIYYYAISPSLYEIVSKNLYLADLTSHEELAIIEKPFGHDLNSSTQLNIELHKYFKESQLYRIDHYLGKETVQNILVTRFSNSIFEPLWNRNYIDYVEITASEALSVGSRAGYYEGSGALRDMVQNHLLQVLALIAMEPPVSAGATCLRNEMVKVFQSLRPIKREEVKDLVIRGQYQRTKEEIGYREEKGVALDSKTETYVALKCFIDNWRWSGIPFYIRTGKALKAANSEVVVHFKDNPHKIFSENEHIEAEPNLLTIRIQPDEGIVLNVGMKVPGYGFNIKSVDIDFHYSAIKEYKISDSYIRLIHDAINKDQTLYQSSEAISLTWSYIEPILEAWKTESDIPLYFYNRGSWGPDGVEKLLTGKDNAWRIPCKSTEGGCKL